MTLNLTKQEAQYLMELVKGSGGAARQRVMMKLEKTLDQHKKIVPPEDGWTLKPKA